MKNLCNGILSVRGRAATSVLAMTLAACAATLQPEDINETAHAVQPIEVSASRVDKVSVRPGRDIPQTLSPMTIFTAEDIHGSGYRDIGSALQSLSPFVGGR
ncbi:MAG: hypothetical protein H0W33_03440 [Gammaproteobacteria bacterium]|nr:hypothetical protein [Gammaproteobacteria bacterium]